MSDPNDVPAAPPLFDAEGNLVKFKPTKAVIGGIIGFVSSVATGLAVILPPDDGVKITLGIITLVVGSAATVLGIYVPRNAAVKA